MTEVPPTSSSAPHSASDLLLATLRAWPEETISISQLTDALGERSFGVIMLFLGLLACISPPGFNSLFAIVTIIYAVQMIKGRSAPWQPQFVANRPFRRDMLIGLIEKAEPQLKKVEQVCRPRWPVVVGGVGERLIAVMLAMLAVCILVPLWGTNFLPGVAVVLLSIALIEQDGKLAVAGFAFGAAAIGITLLILAGLAKASLAAL